GVQTIVFCRSRLQVEVMLSYLQESLLPSLESRRRVRGYRSGYLPLHRREIEADLRSGAVHGVVSTNAVELGMDIGSLQAAVIVGYPGTIASTWQQLGRAGRRTGSIAVFLASSAPLDQFIVRHPEYFLGASPEAGLVDPDNLLVLAGHLQAGLFELPFLDAERFGRADVTEPLRLVEGGGGASHARGRPVWGNNTISSRGRLTTEHRGRQRGHRRHFAGATRSHRRDGPVHGPGHAARRRHISPGRRPVPRRSSGLGREEGLRTAGRRRLLHRRAAGS